MSALKKEVVNPTVDKRIEQYVAIRDKIKSMKEAHEEACKPFQTMLDQIGGWLQSFLDESGSESIRTRHGTCYASTRYSWRRTAACPQVAICQHSAPLGCEEEKEIAMSDFSLLSKLHGEPALSLDEAKAVVATKTAPRVTEESIKAKIEEAEYIINGNLLTICIITMKNGFMVHGGSAPASPSNFDAEVGKRYAYDNAFKQLWQLEGYLLREKLSTGEI